MFSDTKQLCTILELKWGRWVYEGCESSVRLWGMLWVEGCETQYRYN
jgi:hypothetical protein